eukprot:6906741-Pyramimonas_sp.AAC.1
MLARASSRSECYGRSMTHIAPHHPFAPEGGRAMRGVCAAALYFASVKMVDDVIGIYVSENDAMLTYGVNGVLPTKHIWNAVDIPSRQELHNTQIRSEFIGKRRITIRDLA